MDNKELRKNFIELCESILSTPKNYNITLTGRNMSGKSEVLIYILKKLIKSTPKESVYFIDTVNRSLISENAVGMHFPDLNETLNFMGTNSSIVTRRIISNYLNKIDTFSTGEHYLGAFYSYHYLRNKLKEKSFRKDINSFISDFNLNLSFDYKSNKLSIYKNGFEVQPSSGFQAIIRLYIEFSHATTQGAKVIIIDEIDSHLDAFMCTKILNKLQLHFNKIKVISTVHSLNFFQEINFNKIFIIKNDLLNFDIIDSRDITSLDYINREIFNNSKAVDPKKNDIEMIFIKVMNKINLTDKELELIKSDNEFSPQDIILLEAIKDSLNID